jgi:hypothetical protein
MPDTLTIEDLYTKHETQLYIDYSLDNDIIVNELPGTSTYAIIENEVAEKAYYRLETIAQVEKTYFSSTNQYYRIPDITALYDSVEYQVTIDSIYFCRFNYLDGIYPRVGKIDPGESQSVLERTQLAYFQPHGKTYGDTTQYDIYGPYLSVRLTSLNSGAYQYYVDVEEQLEAGSRLYDPIPTQLKGNLYWDEDATTDVLGYFEVSSRTMRNDTEFRMEYECVDTVIIDTSTFAFVDGDSLIFAGF